MIKEHDKWDIRFLNMAEFISGWSKDPSTKCGAVVVRPDKTIASLGFNGFPRGMSDDKKFYDLRDEKLSRVIHAEMNALLTAKESLSGCTLYVYPFSPCDRCAVHIIQAGIKRVVFPALAPQRWQDSFDRTLKYFEEAGVECLKVE